MANHRDFVLANTQFLPVPLVPEIHLHLADEVTPLWSKTEEDLTRTGLPPPFWAFAWAGGQALARYILDHPETVVGKRVIDFASGSGLVAIAAMKAGAGRCTAYDIDPYALAAIPINAAANKVAVEVSSESLVDRTGLEADIFLFGDIFYERDMAARALRWIEALEATGVRVLIGDPERTYLPKERLEKLAQYEVPVSRDLEGVDLKPSSVWRLKR